MIPEAERLKPTTFCNTKQESQINLQYQTKEETNRTNSEHYTYIEIMIAIFIGLIGDNQWEATLHDLVVECVQELFPLYARSTGGIYSWMVFKIREEPENKDQLMSAAREKWITTLNYIQTHADKQKRKYIVGDEVGS